MASSTLCLALVLYLISIVTALSEGFIDRCSQDFYQHDASKVLLRSIDLSQSIDGAIGLSGWAITVDERPDVTETNIWHSKGNQDHLNDAFEACSWLVWGFPAPVLARSRHDTGTCSKAISPNCYSALKYKITASARKWSRKRTPRLLTTPQLCDKIENDLRHDAKAKWPQECWNDFGYESKRSMTRRLESDHLRFASISHGRPNTGTSPKLTNNDSALDGQAAHSSSECTSHSAEDQSVQYVFDRVLSINSSSIETGNPYQDQLNNMYLAISVHVVIANNRRIIDPGPNTQLFCLVANDRPHVDHGIRTIGTDKTVNNGQQQTGSSTIASGSTLTKWGVAGILVAAFIPSFVVIVVFSYIKINKHRKAKRSAATSTASSEQTSRSDQNSSAANAPPITEVVEIGPSPIEIHELGGAPIVEMRSNPARMEAGSRNIFEMNPGEGWLVELPGDSIFARSKRRMSV